MASAAPVPSPEPEDHPGTHRIDAALGHPGSAGQARACRWIGGSNPATTVKQVPAATVKEANASVYRDAHASSSTRPPAPLARPARRRTGGTRSSERVSAALGGCSRWRARATIGQALLVEGRHPGWFDRPVLQPAARSQGGGLRAAFRRGAGESQLRGVAAMAVSTARRSERQLTGLSIRGASRSSGSCSCRAL